MISYKLFINILNHHIVYSNKFMSYEMVNGNLLKVKCIEYDEVTFIAIER